MDGEILLIGASGFLGRALAARLTGRNIVLTHHAHPLPGGSIPFSLTDDDPAVLIDRVEPRVVFLTFRVGDRDADEQTVQHAFRSLAGACGSARVVLASTDAVFAGDRGRYTESDEPAPGTAHGRRYLGYERTLAATCPNACVVRFSYIYGHAAGALDRRLSGTRRALREGKTVPLFDDMYKSPLEVNQAAAVMAALSGRDYKGVVHAGGARMSVYDFQYQAMQVLGERVEGLERSRMPVDQGLQRDTSLDASFLHRLTGIVPAGITESLRTEMANDG